MFSDLSVGIMSLLNKGGACQPPENLQHWEVTKTTKNLAPFTVLRPCWLKEREHISRMTFAADFQGSRKS